MPKESKIHPSKSTFAENIVIEVYGHVINLVVDDTVYLGLKNTKHLDGRKPIDCRAMGMFCVTKSNNWIIVFERSKLTAELIAHECFHATKAIMESKGIAPLFDSNEEAWAYLLGWLVQAVTVQLVSHGEYIEVGAMTAKNHYNSKPDAGK